jgi:hypothetical protein
LTNEAIPEDGRVAIVETYRGVGIFEGQTPERIETIVRPALDLVDAMSNVHDLVAYAADASHPPEARLFAAARAEAIHELAAVDRTKRPDIDLDRVRASVAGLDSRVWYDPGTHGSLLDTPPGGAFG